MTIKDLHHLLFEHLRTEDVKKSRKFPQPHTFVPQPASCGCYHSDTLRNSCTNELLSLLAVDSLITGNKGNGQKLLLYTTKHMHTGFHFQSASACSRRTVCVRVCMHQYVYVGWLVWH